MTAPELWIALRDLEGKTRHQLNALLEEHPTPEAAFAKLRIRPDVAEGRLQLLRAESLGLVLLPRDHPEFPPLLTQIPDAPLVLYRRGSSGFELLGIQRVVCMWAEYRRDAAVFALPALDESNAFPDRVGCIFGVGAALVDDSGRN